MAVTLRGDQKMSSVPATKMKALRINLNTDIYGTFAEIGAGQETVRNFFRAGGASGTIAKAMSAQSPMQMVQLHLACMCNCTMDHFFVLEVNRKSQNGVMILCQSHFDMGKIFKWK